LQVRAATAKACSFEPNLPSTLGIVCRIYIQVACLSLPDRPTDVLLRIPVSGVRCLFWWVETHGFQTFKE